MNDQATRLRSLVSDAASGDRAPLGRAGQPRVVLVASGKGGVGATTVALHLAALAAARTPTLLVDADPAGGDIARICGLTPQATFADLLAGRPPDEVLHTGPQGLQIVPGPWGQTIDGRRPPEGWLAALAARSPAPALIVVDAGTGLNALVERLWPLADCRLMVTTAEPAAVMNCYALTKILAGEASGATPLALATNMTGPVTGRLVAGRVAEALRRFLALELAAIATLPFERRAAQGPVAGLLADAAWQSHFAPLVGWAAPVARQLAAA